MAAGINDKFAATFNSANPNVATVTATRTAAATTLQCDDLSGWPTSTVVHFSTYQINTSNQVVAGTQIDWKGIVSGNNIGTLTRVAGATDAGNTIGDVVEMNPTASWADDLVDGLLVAHNQDGSLKDDAVTTDVIADDAVTTAKIDDGAVTSSKLSTGANSSAVLTGESTTSTSFTDLATAGPSVTVTIGSNGLALVSVESYIQNSGAGNSTRVGVALSGANTVAADTRIFYRPYANTQIIQMGSTVLMTGLNPGSTTFTMKYNVAAGTGTFGNRTLSVVPL